MPKDPVCGMYVDEKTAIKKVIGSRTYYFCSDHKQDGHAEVQGNTGGGRYVKSGYIFMLNQEARLSGIFKI